MNIEWSPIQMNGFDARFLEQDINHTQNDLSLPLLRPLLTSPIQFEWEIENNFFKLTGNPFKLNEIF